MGRQAEGIRSAVEATRRAENGDRRRRAWCVEDAQRRANRKAAKTAAKATARCCRSSGASRNNPTTGWAKNILADLQGEPSAVPLSGQGIMAMIGRKAAIAEVGAHRHEMKGRLAFAAWLEVHAQLLRTQARR